MWRSLIEAGLSIVVKRDNGELIGACLNFDARADEAQPLCACAAFSRNHPDAISVAPTDAKVIHLPNDLFDLYTTDRL